MDPRQPPQHPFSRNGASPFSRPSFASTPGTAASQPPYPPAASHAPATPAPYSDVHARKPSDPPPYYPASRQYPEHGPGPMPSSTHSRHQSTSSITSGPMTRGMPPPNSPPQQQQQHHQQQQQQGQGQGQGPNNHQMGGPYGLPQPRAPPVSVGPPSAFPRGRELPALDSLTRTGSSGSSMSISSMLGGPPTARDSAAPPPYQPGHPSTAPGPPYSQSLHASPRPQPTPVAEYTGFRRPQTPDHRMFESRDPRAVSAASPPAYHSTPEVQRYGTPQAYPQRGPPMAPTEQARESGRLSGGPVPARQMSPPRQYSNVGPPRPVEAGRPPEMYAHREELRPSEEYNPERPIRVMKYDEQRYMSDRERQERERQEREMEFRERELRERELRERERRDMAMTGVEPARGHGMHPQEFARQMDQRAQQYGRAPDPRDWTRPGFEPARAPYDPAMHPPRHQEYPPSTAPHHNGPHPYPSGAVDRPHPPPHAHHQHGFPPPGPPHPQSYESPDRQRMSVMQHMERPHPQQPPPRTREEAVPPPSVAYAGMGPSMYEPSRNRSIEEIGTPHGHQRNLLGVQEINRKGRISPLPQAVQGAQPQLSGPAGEPGIKSEFGRMFSGIGTGVGTLSSPVPQGAQLAYGGGGLLRRDELDVPQEPPVEAAKPTGRGKRRKLKEEDDEGNNGRLTPVGGRGGKKAKGHHHHHHPHHHHHGAHHHHHHQHNLDQVSSPALAGITPFRNIKGSTPVPSPTGLAKDLPGGHHHHHHHHHGGARAAQPNARAVPPPRSPSPVILPKPKQVVASKAVLDSVADRPRTHLGDVVYEPSLKRARLQDARTGRPPRSGFKSTPKPLPWDLIEGKENCTLTMKVGKEHLIPASREEITSRRALWGTDVYTDDSDVIAACIHAGWIRGEWPEDVDVSMLGLDEGYSVSDVRGLLNGRSNGSKETTNHKLSPQHAASALLALSEPPKSGPMPVPENRDLHVTLLILPRLERYASTTRFGIKSREFGGSVGDEDAHQRAVHDGISYMVTGLRWVTNGGAPQNRLRGKARRERIRKALAEVAMTPAWISRPSTTVTNGSANGVVDDGGKEREAGLGWWKHTASRPPSEGDKENVNREGVVEGGQQRHEEVAEQDKHMDGAEENHKDIAEARAGNGKEYVEADVAAAKETEVETRQEEETRQKEADVGVVEGPTAGEVKNGDTEKKEPEPKQAPAEDGQKGPTEDEQPEAAQPEKEKVAEA